mgnify:FL=1
MKNLIIYQDGKLLQNVTCSVLEQVAFFKISINPNDIIKRA